MNHVGTSDLLAALDGDGLTPGQRAHLAGCVDCAGRAQWLDRLRVMSAALPPMLEPALEPARLTPAVPMTRTGYRLVPRAAAAVVAIAAVTLAVRGSRVDGLSSDLRFTDRVVAAGTNSPVEYNPAPWLTTQDSVVVRARFRSPDDGRYAPTLPAVPAGVLHRDGDGVYRGAVGIPDDAAFGVFVVESADGAIVDSNQRRLWDQRIDGPGGSRAAMQQHVNDLLSRNWQTAARMQREWADAHHDDALAWKDVFFLDQEVVPHAGMDSLSAWHHRRFAALDSLYRDAPDPDGDDVAALMWYAIGLGDTASAARWRDRLTSRHPRHPRAVEQRTLTISREGRRDGVALERFETLWNEVGPAHSFLPQTAGMLALELGDAQAARRWLERYAAMRPEVSLWAASTLARFPALREEALSQLETEVALLERYDDSMRPLELSRDRFRRDAGHSVADGVFRLGTTFLALGDTAQAERALVRATTHGWHSGALAELAWIAIERGESERATDLLARAAADPASGLPPDSALARLPGSVTADAWTDAVARARTELTSRILEGAASIPLPARATVADSTGAEYALRDLIGGRPTVIAFWSPWCGPSIEQLPAFQRLADRLESGGARLLLITTEPLDAATRAVLRGRRVTLTPYTDATALLRNTLQQWRTPELHVVDGTGRVRFAASALSRVEREIMAISNQ